MKYKDILARQAAWSRATFGPGERRNGVIEHLQKEIEEFKADGSIEEACDIVVLAHDLLLRRIAEEINVSLSTKFNFDDVGGFAAEAVRNKLLKNEKRVWPNWRDFSEDQAIEHDRSHD